MVDIPRSFVSKGLSIMGVKKQYTVQAKKTAMRYAVLNLCVQILLLLIITQCVWLARMEVHTLTQANRHIFLLLPAYEKTVNLFFQKPQLVHFLSPFVWPYLPYAVLVLLLSFAFSYCASRALKKGICMENRCV